jgi:hypothetical protein
MELDKLHHKLTNISLYNPEESAAIINLIQATTTDLAAVYDKLLSLSNKKHALLNNTDNNSNIKCPVVECNGIVNDNKCITCNITICTSCNTLVKDNHECLESDIQSFNEIKNNSKPCPNCKVVSYKTDGCDLMWCTQCHETWSWNTGELSNERNHNPMYYEWLMINHKNTREIGDYVSGGLPSALDLLECTEINDNILDFCDDIADIEDNIIPGLIYARQQLSNFEKFRRDYIRKRIDEEKFKRIIKKNYLKIITCTNRIMLYNSYLISMYEIFLRINNNKRVDNKNLVEIDKLSLYFADQENNIISKLKIPPVIFHTILKPSRILPIVAAVVLPPVVEAILLPEVD